MPQRPQPFTRSPFRDGAFDAGVVCLGVGKEEDSTQTHELRQEQEARETREHKLLGRSELADEAEQHERRCDKAAYLAEKLAEREEAESE